MPDRRRILSAKEVEQALFVDYEGNVGRPPTLLGWRCGRRTHSAIVEPAFATCARRFRAKSVLAHDHAQTVDHLVELARDGGRVIVSWSEHDLKHMAAVVRADLRDTLQGLHRNAIRTVRAWHGRRFGHGIEDAKLQSVADLLGVYIPERFGPGLVGDALRLIRRQLQQGRAWHELTPAAKQGWLAAVKHNRYDIESMERILEVVSRDPVLTDAL